MKTCKSCKFWSREENDMCLDNAKINRCACNKIMENNSNDIEFRKANKEDILIYQYNEGGNFFTGKDFGCIHHSEDK